MTAKASFLARHWVGALQIAVSILLLVAMLAVVDVAELMDRFAQADGLFMALGLVLGLVQTAILGWRWWLLNARLHLVASVDLANHVALTGLTQAASQVLPSSIGGDAVRVITLRQLGVPFAPAMLSVACDRVAGLLGLVALALFGLALGGIPHGAENVALAAAISAAVAALFVLAGPWIAGRPSVRALAERLGLGQALAAGAALFRAPLAAGGLLGLSIVPHALNVAVAWCAGRALGLDIPPGILFIAMPLAILVMTLPISVAGWGVREAVLVFALGIGGVSSHDALAVSVTWGALLLMLGLIVLVPSLLWLARARRMRH